MVRKSASYPMTTRNDKYNRLNSGWVEDVSEYDEAKEAFHVELKVEEDDKCPIEEVDLTVPKTDDMTLPVFTFRMWFLGIFCNLTLAFFNMFLSFRSEPLGMSPVIAMIVTLPLGHFMARVLPNTRVRIPCTPWSFSLNPGPFNMKEHVLICIFSSCGASDAYAIEVITVMKLFYKGSVSMLGATLLTLTTQCLGYGWAGLVYKFLVEPAHFWWPSTLVVVSLLRAMHEPETGRGMTRLRFFLMVSLLSAIWYLVPGYFAMVLTCVSWLCWVYPNSVTAHQVGDGIRGLGIGALSFDWAAVTAFLGSPLVTPWPVIANVAVGFVFMAWIILPLSYWKLNLYDARRYPVQTQKLYTELGADYPTGQLLTEDFMLNTTTYQEVGPLRMSVFFALSYGLGFATLTAALSHVFLWHGKEIWQHTKAAVQSSTGQVDIHTKLMRKYPPIPSWWFHALLVVMAGLSIWTCESFGFQLPWWGVLAAMGLAAFFTLPVGIIASTTNHMISLNVLTEMVIGYWLPGQPIANIVFKTYGYISMTHAIGFIRDFKLGHYTKVPPRAIFLVQVIGTMTAALVNLLVAFWLFDSVKDMCNQEKLAGSSPWTCPRANTFYSASVIWGVIGPKRMFGLLGEYWHLNWFFLFGLIAPIPFYFLAKAFPHRKWLSKVNLPIMIGATGAMPPAGPINFTSWVAIGFIFNYLVHKYRPNWWARYNYVTSAGLDMGVALMGVFIFVMFQNWNQDAAWNKAVRGWWINSIHDQCPLATCPTAPGHNVATCPPWQQDPDGSFWQMSPIGGIKSHSEL